MYAFAIWVTTGCNLKCSYCYEGDNKENLSISTDTADNIIKFILQTVKSTNKRIIVDFHGGEPLLNYLVIKYMIENLNATELNFFYGITTNGTIYSEEIIDFLTDNFVYSLTVSIDGTEKAHNLNRMYKNGDGTYKCALNTALLLLRKRPDTRIRMTVVPNNIKEISKGIIRLMNYGFKIIVPALDYFNLNWSQEEMECLRKELQIVKHYINDNRKFSDVQVAMVDEKRNKLSSCSGGINAFHIVPNGDIYPCAYSVGDEFEKIGNISNGVNPKKVEYFEKIYKTTNMDCKGCGNYEYCASSRCKFLNQKVTGDYNKPIPVVCAVENVRHCLSSL